MTYYKNLIILFSIICFTGAAASLTISTHNLNFTGLTVTTKENILNKVLSLKSDYLSFEDAKNLQESVEKYLEEQGLFLAEVVLNEKAFNQGILQYDVYEGFISHVVIENPNNLSPRAYKQVMDILNKITEPNPLHRNIYEKYVLMADDISGIELESNLKKSEVLGAAELRVNVVKNNRFDGFVGLNNEINVNNGPMQYMAGLMLNVPEMKSQTTGTGSHSTSSKKSKSWGLSHAQKLGDHGLMYQASFSKSTANPPPKSTANSDFKSSKGGLEVAYPLVKSLQNTVIVKGTFDAYNGKNSDLVGSNSYYDKIRSIRGLVHLEFYDHIFTNYYAGHIIEPQISKGIKGLGSSKLEENSPSREEGKSNYTKLNLSWYRNQYLPRNFSLVTHVKGQYSFNKLLSPEEFDLGGEDFGRGYESSVVTGDKGAAFKAELHYKALLPRYIHELDGFIFYDIGVSSSKVAKITVNNNTNEIAKRASLQSVGLGGNITSNKYFIARFAVGKPLTFPSTRGGLRWTFAVTANLNHEI